MHGPRDRPANPHIYILLINPDYHFIIGLLRLPWNKVTLPNELKLQFTIAALFPLLAFLLSFLCSACVGPVWEPPALSVACGLAPHWLTA